MTDTPEPFGPDLDGRVTPFNAHAVNSAGAYVLCWLQTALRATDNPAIDAAVKLANGLGLPVLVYHGLQQTYPHASDRLHRFILGASRDLQRGCRERGLACVTYVETPEVRQAGLVYQLAETAAAVVTDENFVFIPAWQTARFAARTERAVFAVDAARLVPTRVLPTDIAGTSAFRRESGKPREHYLSHACDFEADAAPYEGALPFEDANLAEASDADLDALVAACDIDHSLPASKEFPATAEAASAALAGFVEHHLFSYPARRNNAADEDGASRLSPYLHFGVLGPRRIAREVAESGLRDSQTYKYRDELLTWREWFHFMAHRHIERGGGPHEAFDYLPERPRASLLEHADDARDTLYDLDTLLHGETEDETWNAAQRQWLATGYMHNNLRMYWGKQIIKWTPHPRDAWITACYINDRLSLDGRDPATYGNMRWIFGDTKPASREQAVYGWVTSKTDGGIRKRAGAPEWLAKGATRAIPRVSVPDAAFVATQDGVLTTG